MYSLRHTRLSHTGTEPRYSYRDVQPQRGTATQMYSHTEVQPHRGTATQKYSHTEVYVTSKLCLNSQWPVSLVPPDGLGGGKCFQTSSEHGGTD